MSLLERAAMQAAMADKVYQEQQAQGMTSNPAASYISRPIVMQQPTKKKSVSLRRGKWTQEEEAYANRLIQEFKAGLLPLTDGTTLRTFLSKLLNCDPMRISKKFVGNNCIGKQVFRRKNIEMSRMTMEELQRSRNELTELERKFLDRVSQTNRCKPGGLSPSKFDSILGGGGGIGAVGTSGGMTGGQGGVQGQAWQLPPQNYQPLQTNATAAGHSLLRGDIGDIRSQGGMGMNQGGGMYNQPPPPPQHSSTGYGGYMGYNMGMSTSAPGMNLHHGIGDGVGVDSVLNQNPTLSQLKKVTSQGSHKNSSSFEALMSLDFASMQSMEEMGKTDKDSNTVMMKTTTGGVNWNGDNNDKTKNPPATGNVPAAANAATQQNARVQVDAPVGSTVQLPSNVAGAVRAGVTGGNQSAGRVTGGQPLSLGTSENVGDQAARLGSILRSLSQDSIQKKGLIVPSIVAPNSTFTATAAGEHPYQTRGIINGDMLRVQSGTGLTALRELQGLNQRNSSVDDFLSLVASGDIPAQDPQVLKLPLQSLINSVQKNPSQQNLAALHQLQQQILAQQQSRVGQLKSGAQMPPGSIHPSGVNPATGDPPNPPSQVINYQEQLQKMQQNFQLQQQYSVQLQAEHKKAQQQMQQQQMQMQQQQQQLQQMQQQMQQQQQTQLEQPQKEQQQPQQVPQSTAGIGEQEQKPQIPQRGREKRKAEEEVIGEEKAPEKRVKNEDSTV